jgi:hypothetical protein
MAEAGGGPQVQLPVKLTNILCPQEARPGLRIVQDFRQLNQHLHIDKYSMKEINECNLAEWLARSPRAIKTIKDLDATIATFTPVRPTAEYEVSEYATGNRCWRHTPYQHPVSIQDLLLHDIKTHQEKNKLLGEKVEKIVLQNQLVAQQASSI